MALVWHKQSVKELRERKTRKQLQEENEALKEQVTGLEATLDDTMLALCDVYELLVGGDS